MERLLDAGYKLMIETSGERPLADVPKAVHKIVDVKCPGAGAAANASTWTTSPPSPKTTKSSSSSPIATTTNLPAISSPSTTERARRPRPLSPAFSKTPSPLRTTDNATLDPRNLVEWMLADGLDARLTLQIHKFIWEPMKKGV